MRIQKRQALYTLMITLMASAQSAPAATSDVPVVKKGLAKRPVRVALVDPATTPKTAGIEDVVVTAQRRSEKLQNVPLSDTVFTSGDIRARQIKSVADALNNVPGVITWSGAGYQQANYYFRGDGTSVGYQTIDSPVATYLDDVVMGRTGGANLATLDMQRVEVLKGPQGTTFGKNTTAGAVLLYSQKPLPVYSLSGEASYGTHGQTDDKAAINIPISDTFFTRFAGSFFNEEGYQHDIATQRDGYGGQKNWAVRGSARWEPNDAVDWNTSVDYSHESGELYVVSTIPTASNSDKRISAGIVGQSYQALTTTLNNCTSGGSALDWEGNNCSGSVATSLGGTSNINVIVNPSLSLQSITGVRQTTQDYSTDFGRNSPYSALKDYVLVNDSTYQQLSQELKASGSVLRNRVHYVGGFYFFREWDTSRVDDFIRIAPATVRTGDQNHWLRNGTTSEAGYLQTDTSITKKLILTTGVRYTHDRKQVATTVTKLSNGKLIYDTSSIAGDPVVEAYRWTPRVSLAYHFTPDLMAYGSFIKGFTSGGWNGTANTASAFNDFRDETAKSWELGVRSEWLDHRLRLNATLFWVNYKNMQLQTNFADPATGVLLNLIENAGNVRDRGLEVDSQAMIRRDLSLNLGVSLQNAVWTRVTPDLVATGINKSSEVPYTPPFTLNAGLTYRPHFAFIPGALRMDGYAQFITAYNSQADGAAIASKAQTILNGSVSYTPLNSRLTFQLECTNCLFRYYVPIAAGSYDYVSQPGYAGFRVRYAL